MPTQRPSSDHQRGTLKAAFRHSVLKAGGPDSFAQITRVEKGQLSKYGSADGQWDHSHAPLDIALDADLDCGEPVCARALADLQGYDLVKRQAAKSNSAATPLASISVLTREHADLIDAIITGASDGVLTPLEISNIRKEALEVQSAISKLLASLEGAA